MKIDPTIFKAYDIRGVYPSEIDEQAAYKIAQAYAKLVNPKVVALACDVRLSGPALFESMKNGFIDHGVNVVDIGIVTTDMLYFAVANYKYDGGVIISASHNPREYNGMKMVRAGAVPISGDTGIKDIQKLVLENYAYKHPTPGTVSQQNVQKDYLEKCLSFIDKAKIKPLKVVCNAMFGPAVKNVLGLSLPLTIIPMNAEPNGSFPKGTPDPLLEENRIETVAQIKKEQVDLGAAWDADADRFFLFDETGRWVPGYYLTAFLAKYFCSRNPGAKIIFDPRAIWATIHEVTEAGGAPVINKAGHSFIKERMRKEEAVFAGEMSGHYYFKDYFYCDNGLIPFLLILQIVSESGQKVSKLFDEYFIQYPISGEINIDLPSPSEGEKILSRLSQNYGDAKQDRTDGLSIEYPEWRGNVRASNTQALLRLNVEAKSEELLKQKTQELLNLIKG
ncbi:MAG TPA: phosphomannomutase/phosphoglucomutase [Methylomirabilota bacterium]|nr:phosphomannomutase/phosphoglucomutase [Methylomirabilota bacterium]